MMWMSPFTLVTIPLLSATPIPSDGASVPSSVIFAAFGPTPVDEINARTPEIALPSNTRPSPLEPPLAVTEMSP